MRSLAAALRISAAISMSMITRCLTWRSHSQMPTMHSTVRPVRKILSMVTCWFEVAPRRTQFVDGPARTSVDRQTLALAAGQSQIASVRDHGGVVGTEFGTRVANDHVSPHAKQPHR